MVNFLDPWKNYISYVYSRNHCAHICDRLFVKDLRILENRDPKNIVIVDNSVISFASNIENGIYIPTFKGETNDNELLLISNFLKSIVDAKDLRPHITKFAGIKALYEKFLGSPQEEE